MNDYHVSREEKGGIITFTVEAVGEDTEEKAGTYVFNKDGSAWKVRTGSGEEVFERIPDFKEHLGR
jgi:hypothetical protein